MIAILVIPFFVGAMAGGVVGTIIGHSSLNPDPNAKPVTFMGFLGGIIGGLLYWIFDINVLQDYLRSFPRHPNEFRMGNYQSFIPVLLQWGSMLAFGMFAGALASVMGLAALRSSFRSVPNEKLDGPRVAASVIGDSKKTCGGCGAIANVYSIRCHECKGVFVEDDAGDRT